MTSRCPSVVSRPTVAPLRSSSAFVATVVPCTIRSVRASRPVRSVPHSAASRPSPSIKPSDWSRGVDAHFAMTTRPPSSTAARSVNVPPTSIPIRHIALNFGGGPYGPLRCLPQDRIAPAKPAPAQRLGAGGSREARPSEMWRTGEPSSARARPPRRGRGRPRVPGTPSVESCAIAGREPALVVLHRHAGNLHLIVEDLRRADEPADVGPARRLPESRSLERLRAVQEHLLDLDADREARNLTVDGH